jgi:hypothetical protein
MKKIKIGGQAKLRAEMLDIVSNHTMQKSWRKIGDMISYNIEMQIIDQVYSRIENNLKNKLNYEEY